MPQSAPTVGQLPLNFGPPGLMDRYLSWVKLSGDASKFNLDALKLGLTFGETPNNTFKWSNDEAPALHQWALLGNPDAVYFFLDIGADIALADTCSRTALKYACAALNWATTSYAEQAVKLLIDAGSDVNVKSTLGYTPLMWATRAGNLEITQLLLEKGANANETDNNGYNALYYAKNPRFKHNRLVTQNRKPTIALLRKHGGKTGEELEAEAK